MDRRERMLMKELLQGTYKWPVNEYDGQGKEKPEIALNVLTQKVETVPFSGGWDGEEKEREALEELEMLFPLLLWWFIW